MAERGLWRKTRDAFLTPITQVIPRILGVLLGSGAETKYVILIMSQGTCLNLVCIWSCYFCLKHIGGGVIYKLINYIEQNHSSMFSFLYIIYLFILFLYLFILFLLYFTSVLSSFLEHFCFIAGDGGLFRAYRGQWGSLKHFSNHPFSNIWLLVSYGLCFPPLLSLSCFCTPLLIVSLSGGFYVQPHWDRESTMEIPACSLRFPDG